VPLGHFGDRFPSVTARLLQAKLRGRVGHAYLFAGDDTELLSEFVSAWVAVCACASPQPDGDACGACESCLQLAGGHYAGLFEVRPQSKSRRILIDDIRGLEHQLGLVFGRGRLKVGLIAEADCMGEEAQNAFLKTLEEPSPGTLLVLYTTQARGLLPTIRSRCQFISLLRNRQCYERARALGVFSALAGLRPGAGAKAGLSAANRFSAILSGLRSDAEEAIGDESDSRWEAVAADDRVLKRRLAEAHAARIEAEYLRLRAGVLDAVHAWFLQQLLITAGVTRAQLPHPELLDAAGPEGDALSQVAWPRAVGNLELADELLRCLSSNVNERLALEAFCLSVSERR